MSNLLIQAPDMGLNCLLPDNLIDPREAARGSYGLIYEKGKFFNAPGLAKYNLTSALNSGDKVLHAFVCRVNGSDYVIAKTQEKIYRYDAVNDEWDDITESGTTMDSDEDHPISFAVVSHDDTDIYYNEDSEQANAYEHVVICDGGLSNIQRWAGALEDDTVQLSGSSGYSGEGPHRALQVGTAQNRLLLISPYEYDTSSRLWVPNPVRVRWPIIGKLQTWTGTGSGAVDLRDTGGNNVWSAALGSEYYVYQDNSIWNLRYVGGLNIFDPLPVVRDMGLLSYHLLVSQQNVHFFVGTDYNVYAFLGGTQLEAIGTKIRDYLVEDIETDYLSRCWLAVDVNAEHLWLFIVPSGGTYATKAYVYSLIGRSWTLVDLSAKFNATSGITAVSKLAGTSTEVGETYRTALTQLSLYDISDGADATERYGDVLCDSSRTLTSEVTNATWCAGGTYLSCATGAFLTDMTIGDVVRVEDGSLYTNCRYGTHFYSIGDLSDSYFTLNEREASLGISDTTAVPSGVPITVWTDVGPTYADAVDILKTAEQLVVGTNDGWIYVFDSSLAGDLDGEQMPARHLTPVIDGGRPGVQKRWPGLRVTARGPSTDVANQILVYYRTSGFDSTDGWQRIDPTWTLDATWATKQMFINRTAERIQFMLADASGSTFEVREIEVLQPQIEENR